MIRVLDRVKNGRHGFTLIEVIVAMLILVTGIAAALKLFPAGLEAQQRAFGMSQGVFFAEHATEQIQRDGQNSFENFPGMARPMPASKMTAAGTAIEDKKYAYVGSYAGGAITVEPWTSSLTEPAAAAYNPGNLKVVYVSVPLVDRVVFRGTVAMCKDSTSSTGRRVSPGFIRPEGLDVAGRLDNVVYLLPGRLVLMVSGKAQGHAFVIQSLRTGSLQLRVKDNPVAAGVKPGDAFVVVDRSDFQTLMSDVGLTQILYGS